MKRIGVMGGTFNPIHLSHLLIAGRAYDFLGLDKVLFMPSKNPPYKSNAQIVSEGDRCNMIELAIRPYQFFELSDYELKREGPTYSADTFSMLRSENPDTKYYFIIGGDSLDYFDEWHEPGVILENCSLVVAPRATENKSWSDTKKYTEYNFKDTVTRLYEKYSYKREDGSVFAPEIIFLPSPLVSIASSDIRDFLKCGLKVDGMMPCEVIDYINEKNLYEDKRFIKIKQELKMLLKPKRYQHVLDVAEMSFKLAKLHGYDPVKAYTAGLLHDCAKHLSDEEILAEADRLGIETDEIERRLPRNLLHSKVGAVWAGTKYGIEDEDIINAICYHTTGRPEMGTLEKIVYMSDVIEPGREIDYTPSLDVIRSVATYDLDLACAYVLDNVVPYVLKTYRENVCRLSVDTYEYYKRYLK